MNSKKLKAIKPQVSIGLPVYNAELFIRKKIESLLEQTFTNFELIISDNGSTDSTFRICEEYAKHDNRIKLFKNETNLGAPANYNIVLNHAQYEYFMWTAADDIIDSTFIEKVIPILENNDTVVGSTSRIEMFGDFTEYIKPKKSDSQLKKKIKKIQRRFSRMDCYSVYGKTYEERVRNFLKDCNHNQIFYSIYKTNVIRQLNASYLSFLGSDTAFVLMILKFGDIAVVDEILIHVGDGGISRRGVFGVSSSVGSNPYIPFYSFISWCRRNLGMKIFLENIGFFIKIFIIGEIFFIVDSIRLISRTFSKKDCE